MEKLYSELASWWPVFSPPAHYVEEAAHLLGLLRERVQGTARHRLLELGCGGGSLASHLSRDFELTLVDLSPQMLDVCRTVNPKARLLIGDMRSVRLGDRFDVVLVHDAIMYATSEEDLRATIATAAAHCAPGGFAVFLPDYVKESFQPSTECDGTDGVERSLRYVEWKFDPDPSDTVFEAHYAFLLRENGQVRVAYDVHRCGLFARSVWERTIGDSMGRVETLIDPWRASIFIGSHS